MQRCCHCHGRFGLVSHRFFFHRFCSLKCVGVYKHNLPAAIEERLSQWRSALLTSMTLGKPRTDVRLPLALSDPLRRQP